MVLCILWQKMTHQTLILSAEDLACDCAAFVALADGNQSKLPRA
tara:strand:- start:3515 stop:3646 length:132 start_codon:yes stop_codon:yes gene_type:complete